MADTEIAPAPPQLTAWDRWLALAEELAQCPLADDEAATRAFRNGTLPEDYVNATAEPCQRCQTPGAPSHEPSPRCHYRPRIVQHCTCRACF